MADIISIVNLKENCGKTTLGINFSYILSEELKKNVAFIEYNQNSLYDTDVYLKIKKNENNELNGFYECKTELDNFIVFQTNQNPIPVINQFEQRFDYFLVDFDNFEPIILFNSKKIIIPVQLNPVYLPAVHRTIQELIKIKIPLNRINIFVNKSRNNLLRIEDIQEIFSQIKIAGILPYKNELKEIAEKGEIFCKKNKKDIITVILKRYIEELIKEKSEISQKNEIMDFDIKKETNNYENLNANEKDKYRHLKIEVKRILYDKINIKEIEKDALNNPEKRQKILADIEYKLSNIVDEKNIKFLNILEREGFIKDIYNEIAGLGPLEDLLKNPEISEIMVNGYDNIYIEKNGKIIKSDKKFSDDEAVLKTIERIVTPLGRRIDESMPYVDARLQDGSRVNAIIPPLAIDGPTITIRKFSKKKLAADDLINFGSITKEAVEFLKEAVIKRKNILISGGTGSGKTTLLNILSSFIPSDERIITIEDSAELKLLQEHVVRLEARPANIEGKGEITIRDLVKNALRMRPDRIVVGECRGGETLDMLQAMNTGHEGSMTTVHANSPRDALSRLEVMVLMAGTDLPLKAIREQIKSAIDIIVQQARLKDGSRKVTYVSEITGMDGDIILMQNVFEFEEIGFKNNRIIGNLKRVDNIFIK